ncbi:MAG TPA: ThiF family adenylyltransferase [Steroidobacteraceae bacterium]|nr:ThiF family adenylyltransferase [Steroidobacteraceae bacterium]
MSGFTFTHAAIDPGALAAGIELAEAGGFAAFEGRVRNHNEGRRVTGLEYEAFEALALEEGARIVAAAVLRHDVLAAQCVHRLGALAIGDVAVWVGVAARHRAEAFAACREIIDEIKHRLPIWKKELYVGGDSGWVNCERCAEHAHGPAVAFDYSRQAALPEVGPEGQRRLGEATVAVIGAGGLGCAVLAALAGAGVGTLIVVDHDVVEPANLHRQPLYALADAGRPKAEAAAARLAAYNPSVRVVARVMRLDAGNADAIAVQCDVIVDCSDNFATKFLVNDAAVRSGRPAVLASVYQYEGQLQVVRADTGGSCLRCQWPEATRDGLVGNCEQSGVLGPVPAVLGQLQAMETLKLLLGLPGQLRDELLLVDLLDCSQRRLVAPRSPDCAGACIRVATADSGAPEALEVSLPIVEAAARGFRIIDIREPEECAFSPLPVAGQQSVPMGRFLGGAVELDPEARYLLVCAHGVRSRALAEWLRAQGRDNVWSLQGGLEARS